MPLDRYDWIGIAATALAFGVALLGLVGEWLGWWNDTGELLITSGAAAGLLLAVITALQGATRRHVRGVERSVESVQRSVEGVQRSVEGVQRSVDSVHDAVEAQTPILVEIRDRL